MMATTRNRSARLETTSRYRTIMVTYGAAAAIAWGALAFGAVYPWAFAPLLAASFALGVASHLIAPPGAGVNWPLAAALGTVAMSCLIQLVPLRAETLAWVSPAADRLLREYDLLYAHASGNDRVHSISINPKETWLGLVFLAVYAVLLLGLARIFSRREIDRLAGIVATLGATLAVIAIVQRATSTGKVYGFWTPLMGKDPFGPFVNRNHFAGWMLMGLPLSIGLFCGLVARGMRGVDAGWRNRLLWFSSPDASRILLVGFAVVIMGLSLILTLSRSGIACLAAVFLLTGLFAARKQGGRSERVIIGGYLMFVAAIAVSWAGVDAIIKRFADPATRDLSGRLPIWADTIQIIRDFPLVGTGLNTYGTATLFYQRTLPNAHLAEAHNDYLQLAAEGGWLVGLPIAVAAVVFVRQVYRRFRSESDEPIAYWIRAGAVAGLAGIALQSVAEFSLQLPGNAVLFVALCAIALHRAPARPV